MDKESDIYSSLKNQNLLIVALIFAFLLLSFVVWERGYDDEIGVVRQDLKNLKEFHERQISNDRGEINRLNMEIREMRKEKENAP